MLVYRHVTHNIVYSSPSRWWNNNLFIVVHHVTSFDQHAIFMAPEMVCLSLYIQERKTHTYKSAAVSCSAPELEQLFVRVGI
jgi:hypothetical protein